MFVYTVCIPDLIYEILDLEYFLLFLKNMLSFLKNIWVGVVYNNDKIRKCFKILSLIVHLKNSVSEDGVKKLVKV